MATREQALGFIKEIAPIVQEVCKSRDKWILPSVAIAQAACESNYGTSKAMAAANGLFGFKVGKGVKYGDGWKGKSYSTKTKEYYSGYVTITDNFRSYDSVKRRGYGLHGLAVQLVQIQSGSKPDGRPEVYYRH